MKISIAFALALFFFAGSLSAQQTHTPFTREQIRQLQLHDIDEAIHEKSHPASEWDVPAERGSMQSESLGEGKISTSYPESEVHAAINPHDTNNIVVSPIHNGNGSFYMPIYYTTNFGTSWSKSSFSPKPLMGGITVTGGGDPLFAYDADGTLYYTWIDTYVYSYSSDTTYGVIYWASSKDGGKTWQRSAHDAITANWTQYNASRSAIANTTGFDDKQWLAVDRTNSPYHNSLYMAWTKIGKDDAAVMLVVKRAGVDSFAAPVRVSTPDLIKVQYTSIGIDAKGGIHVTFMGSKDRQYYGIYHAYSADGGKTFQAPIKIADADVPNQSFDAVGQTIFGIRLQGNYPCPHLSIDTANTGNLYMIWNAYGSTDNLGYGSQIYFSRSTNNGMTWSDTVRVNSDPQTDLIIDHFFPTIAVGGDGTITAGWYDRREDPDNNLVGRYYMAVSTDQGKRWANMPVATKAMDFAHVQDKSGGKTYGFGVGEYTQMLVTPHYTIPIWADDRTNDGNLRIYASFFSRDTIAVYSTIRLLSDSIFKTIWNGESASEAEAYRIADSIAASIYAGLHPPLAGVRPERTNAVESGLALLETYPNPATTSVHCTYELDEAAHLRVVVSDVRGNVVQSLFNDNRSQGQYELSFDVSNLPNGTYYLTLESNCGGYVSRAFTVSH